MLLTDRMELWLPQPGDLAEMHGLSEDKETRRYLGPEPDEMADSFARLLRNSGSWNLYGYGNFILRLHGEANIIGNCGVFRSFRGFGRGMDDVAEAGWIIARALWGQGLAGEAMRAILAWFDTAHGPQRITCMIERGNTTSENLAHSLGFRAYGQHQPEDGGGALVFHERIIPEAVGAA